MRADTRYLVPRVKPQFIIPVNRNVLANQHGDLRLSRHAGDVDTFLHPAAPDVLKALMIRDYVSGPPVSLFTLGLVSGFAADSVQHFLAHTLVLPRSTRWKEAVSTALLGGWCDPLLDTGQLPATALGALKAEARTLHRQLVPLWMRRTRHGRVLSLDADLGGLSLYDLVVADVDLLAPTAGGVFEDERLNRVLRDLDPAERNTVFAYAEGEGTTWAEAAAAVGASDPAAFGERVRRKAKRLAAEQARRAGQRRPSGSAAVSPITAM
nr:hypothetical protein OH837_00525 [Streptomyces canus]